MGRVGTSRIRFGCRDIADLCSARAFSTWSNAIRHSGEGYDGAELWPEAVKASCGVGNVCCCVDHPCMATTGSTPRLAGSWWVDGANPISWQFFGALPRRVTVSDIVDPEGFREVVVELILVGSIGGIRYGRQALHRAFRHEQECTNCGETSLSWYDCAVGEWRTLQDVRLSGPIVQIETDRNDQGCGWDAVAVTFKSRRGWLYGPWKDAHIDDLHFDTSSPIEAAWCAPTSASDACDNEFLRAIRRTGSQSIDGAFCDPWVIHQPLCQVIDKIGVHDEIELAVEINAGSEPLANLRIEVHRGCSDNPSKPLCSYERSSEDGWAGSNPIAHRLVNRIERASTLILQGPMATLYSGNQRCRQYVEGTPLVADGCHGGPICVCLIADATDRDDGTPRTSADASVRIRYRERYV